MKKPKIKTADVARGPAGKVRTIAQQKAAKQKLANKDRSKTLLAKNKAARKAKGITKKPKKKINSRAKGAAGEREFANFLKAYGFQARRGQQFAGGGDSPDVHCGGLFQRIHLEIKRVEAGSPYVWYEQACRDADVWKTPVVAHRRNGKPWVVILDARDFINILKGEHHG